MRDLQSGEIELNVDDDELWYRQAYPDVVSDRDQVSIGAFRLRSEDQSRLSGARSAKQSAEGAYLEHVGRGLASAGTWAVSVGEVRASGVRCVDDSAVSGDCPQPQGHTYVDFRDTPSFRYREIRLLFVDKANRRGAQYRPPEPPID